MELKKPQIIILETNQVYDSITAAARAVGVDPSNARKALKGTRSSAGGYHFSELETAPERRAQIVRAAKSSEKRQLVSAARKNLISAVHERMVDINKRAANAKKEKLFTKDPVLQKMMSHTDFFGANKRGGYDTSYSHLKNFNDEELKNFLKLVASDQKEYADSVYKSKTRDANSYALQFGISTGQLDEYWHILPAIFSMFEAAKQSSEFAYKDQMQREILKSQISEAMQAGVDPDDLLNFVQDLKNFFRGNSSEDLYSIFENFSQTYDSSRDWEEWEES